MTVIPIINGALVRVIKGLVLKLQDLEIRGRFETFQNYSIIKIRQNTGKSPGELRRLAATHTLVINHRPTLML